MGAGKIDHKEIGAFPYRIKNGQVFIVLVTSRKGNWILPKGQPMLRCGDKQVALLEAYEEAGVKGSIKKKISPEEVLLRNSKGNVKLMIYPLQLKKLLQDWPENRFRKRLFIRADKAVHMVNKRPLQRCILKMSKRALAAAKTKSKSA